MIVLRTLTSASHGAPVRYLQVHHGSRFRGAHNEHVLTALIDLHTACDRLSLRPTWLLTETLLGRVPHYQLGENIRYDPHELQNWVKTRKVHAIPEDEW
jgi:hypothetical protein